MYVPSSFRRWFTELGGGGLSESEVQDLIDDAIDAIPAAASTPWTTILRGEGNQTAASTVLANDADLHFAVVANKNYVVRGRLDIFSNGTPGAKVAITFPHEANGSEFTVDIKTESGGGTAYNWYKNSTGAIIVVATGFDRASVYFQGTFTIDGAGGTFAVQHAQVISDAAANIIRGGYVEYAVLPAP